MRFLPFDRVEILSGLRSQGLLSGVVVTEEEPLDTFIERHYAIGEFQLKDATAPALLERPVVAVRADVYPAIVWPVESAQLRLLPPGSASCN